MPCGVQTLSVAFIHECMHACVFNCSTVVNAFLASLSQTSSQGKMERNQDDCEYLQKASMNFAPPFPVEMINVTHENSSDTYTDDSPASFPPCGAPCSLGKLAVKHAFLRHLAPSVTNDAGPRRGRIRQTSTHHRTHGGQKPATETTQPAAPKQPTAHQRPPPAHQGPA
jgi:hypothetical protein